MRKEFYRLQAATEFVSQWSTAQSRLTVGTSVSRGVWSSCNSGGNKTRTGNRGDPGSVGAFGAKMSQDQSNHIFSVLCFWRSDNLLIESADWKRQENHRRINHTFN